MHDELMEAEESIQRDQKYYTSQEALCKSKDVLRKIQNVKIQGLNTRAKLNWIEQGDKGSKMFFQMLKTKDVKGNIESICDDGMSITDQQGILQAFS